MLKNITWSEYFMVVGLLVICYYAFIMMKYYKKKEQDSSRYRPDSGEDESLNYHKPYESEMNSISDELFDQAQELIERLKKVIREATVGHASKEELMLGIQSQLGDYPSLNTEEFRPGITSMIVIECDNNSSVALSESEVVGLW